MFKMEKAEVKTSKFRWHKRLFFLVAVVFAFMIVPTAASADDGTLYGLTPEEIAVVDGKK